MQRVIAVFCCFLIIATTAQAASYGPAPQPNIKAERIARLGQKLGSGTDAFIALRMKDKTTLTGWVAQWKADSLDLVNPNTGEHQLVAYSNVARLAGYNMATGVQVQEGAGITGKLARIATILPGQRMHGNSFTKRGMLIVGIAAGVVLTIILVKIL